MKREDDPILRFAAWLLLFTIATVVDVLRTLCNPVVGCVALVLVGAAWAGWGFQNALDMLAAILIVIVIYHWVQALATTRRL